MVTADYRCLIAGVIRCGLRNGGETGPDGHTDRNRRSSRPDCGNRDGARRPNAGIRQNAASCNSNANNGENGGAAACYSGSANGSLG